MNFSKLTDYLDSLGDKFGVPAVDCKVTQGHETLYRHSAGYADVEGMRPVSDADLYQIYSATKVVTIIAAMQLCEQGLLSLEDRLDHYMPEFSEMNFAVDFPIGSEPLRWPTRKDRLIKARNPIRVVDLFRMTAGFTYDMDAPELQTYAKANRHGGTMREAMASIANMPLICEPGTRWVYSLAHDVLGGLVEVISGERFSDYLRRHIFDPLAINDMYFTLDAAQQKHLSAQYCMDASSGKILPWCQPSPYQLTDGYESGGAGLICTVDAYSQFVQALANGGVGATGNRIITTDSLHILRQNHLNELMLKDFAATGKKGYGYGLGVRTLMDANASKSPIGEFGWDGAAGAYVLVDLQNRLGIFMAEHVLNFLDNYRVIHPTVRDLVYDALG